MFQWYELGNLFFLTGQYHENDWVSQQMQLHQSNRFHQYVLVDLLKYILEKDVTSGYVSISALEYKKVYILDMIRIIMITIMQMRALHLSSFHHLIKKLCRSVLEPDFFISFS